MRSRVLLSLLFLAANGCAEVKSRWAIEKTRYAGDSDYPCGHRLEPAHYCTNYSVTPELRRDPEARRAKQHCLDFYREALESTTLLCAYFEEMDSLTFWGEGDDSAIVTAKGKRIHRKYAERAMTRARELEHAYSITGGRGAKGAVEELSFDGKESLKDELECRETPGRAGGLLLVGLAAQARRDQKATFEKLQAALLQIAEHTSLSPALPWKSLRAAMNVTRGDGQAAGVALTNLSSEKLDETKMLALGKQEVPASPELETYYAEAVRRAGPQPTVPVQIRGVSTGRSLASVRCRDSRAPASVGPEIVR